MVETPTDAKKSWLRQAMLLSRLVQAGWWWSFFAKGLLAGAALLSVALIGLRISGQGLREPILVFLVFLCVWSWLALRRSRRHLLSGGQALSRLDVALGLNHRLVSAHDGIAPWPEAPPAVVPPLKWDLAATLPPPVLALCLLLFGLFLPLPEAEEPFLAQREEPAAWGETAALIEALKREELVQPEALETLEKQLEALREKPREEWFRQGTLETTEQMRQQVERDARNMQRAMAETAALLGAAAQHAEQLSPGMSEQMGEMLGDLLKQMEQGSLPVSDELLSQLQQLDMENLPQMSEEQLRNLEEMLSQACENMGQCMGEGGMPAQSRADAMAKMQAMLDAMGASGKPGESPGASPLTFTNQGVDLAANTPMPLSNPDMNRAALGDLLKLGEGEHEVDASEVGNRAGGVASEGGAGEAVWREALLPDEEKQLQQYFK